VWTPGTSDSCSACAEREVLGQPRGRGGRAPRRGGQRLGLGGERHALRVLAPEQRLDAEPVAHQQQLARLAIEEREREHAAQRRERGGTARLDQLQDHLAVAVRIERRPWRRRSSRSSRKL
jgi:hypothetical protein